MSGTDGTPGRRVALVPGALALLPRYAGLADPVPELRAACRAAVAWLCESGGPVSVVASVQGARVARHLVSDAGGAVADGSASDRGVSAGRG